MLASCTILTSFSLIFIKFSIMVLYSSLLLLLLLLLFLANVYAFFSTTASSDDKRFSRFSENFSGVKHSKKCICIDYCARRNRLARIDSVALFVEMIMTCAISCNISVGFHSSILAFINYDVKSHIFCRDGRELCSRTAFAASSIIFHASSSTYTILIWLTSSSFSYF